MLMLRKGRLTLLLVAATAGTLCAQQVERNGPSTTANARCELPGGNIVVKYGANESTSFTTDDDLVTVAGNNIPAGTYTISTIPNSEKWTMVIKMGNGSGGASSELARIPMSLSTLSSPVENLTISFDHTPIGCKMHISLDKTQASVEFNSKNTDLPVVP
jgi:Protein of unknown function (DUF2911)